MSVVDAILQAPISPAAKEMASELVDAWIMKYGSFDAQFETIAVESSFFLWLDTNTLVVGAMDRIARDSNGIIGFEFKSVREPKKTRTGADGAWWNEEIWLDQIKNSPQLSFYALALHDATFVTSTYPLQYQRYQLSNPRIVVRAVLKSSPVRFWPENFENGVFGFPDEYLERVVVPAISVRAEGIRAMRKTGQIPWALPGIHCVNKFHRVCPYFERYCQPHEHPIGGALFDFNDPGSTALQYCDVDEANPDLVIFSASSFQTAQECPEKYRLLTGLSEEKESAIEQEIGTGLHTALAQHYKTSLLTRSPTTSNSNKVANRRGKPKRK